MMNLLSRVRHVILAAVIAPSALACGSSAGPSGGAASTEATAAGTTALLATVTAKNGEYIEFRENRAGGMIIVDRYRHGASGLVTTEIAKLTPAKVFSVVSGNQPVPEALLAAENRFLSGENAPAVVRTAPPLRQATPIAPKFYDFTWWVDNICTQPNNVVCATSNGEVDGAWEFGTEFTVTAAVDGSASGPGTIELYGWNGTNAFLISDTDVEPGTIVTVFQYDAPPAWHTANILTAPGATEEDLAEQSFQPTVTAFQLAINSIEWRGDYWFGARDVEVGLGNLPPNGRNDYFDFAATSNNSFDDIDDGLVCTPGSGSTSITVLARSSFPTWVNESATESNYVQSGCF